MLNMSSSGDLGYLVKPKQMQIEVEVSDEKTSKLLLNIMTVYTVW